MAASYILENVKMLDGVLDCEVDVRIGEAIINPTNDTNRHGYFIIFAESIAKLDTLSKKIADQIKIDYV